MGKVNFGAFAVAVLSALLVACGARERAITDAAPPGPGAPERAYHAPPEVEGVARLAGAGVQVRGRAAAGAEVRVADPSGAAAHARADPAGAWRLTLPAGAAPRLFGVSMVDGGRLLQAEGYLAVTPEGLGARLRAGSGAQVLAPRAPGPRLRAVDFDSQGVAVVSGTAPRGMAVTIAIDGRRRGAVTADGAGAFALPVDEPLTAGDHRLEISALGRAVSTTVAVVAPAPFIGPFSAARTADGWRIDWTTPGGGRQTTLLFPPGRSAG